MWIDKPTREQLPALQALWVDAFGEDPAMEPFFWTAFSPERCRCVTVDGTLAAALYWFDTSCQGTKLAYLYAVGTLRNYRGCGLCRELMDYTTRCLISMGYEGILLVPGSPELSEMYRKMGYEFCTAHREFLCAPDPEPVEYHKVDISEYALRRRALLPRGAVVQEGENLSYLAELAEFYEGSNFLLAAIREGNHLLGLELLGDPNAAPGILRALGVTKGTFRTPGTGEDFAMYRPLTDHCPKPGYFAFAFE